MSTRKPNILVLFTDDQRFDTLGALGNPAIQTPHLDALVRRGTTFTHAHIPCGTSGAVCMPSRAMLHTGRTLFHLQDAGSSIPEDHTLMGEHLRANGYHTFGTGKWHNGPASYHRSFCSGAEIYLGGMADHWNMPASDYDPTGKYDNIKPTCPNPWFRNTIWPEHCDYITPGKHSSELLADAAIDFLRDYEGDDPFFAYVSFLAPHDPRTMPEEFRTMYDPDNVDLPPNFMPEHPFDNGELDMRDEALAAKPRQEAEIRRHLAEYYAMITHLDHEIGKVLATLDEQGLTDDTIIVFAGDNGLAVGQHGLMGKQSCYEHSVRVPLVFAGPGVPENAKRDSYVYLLDIFPTLCSMVGLDLPRSVEGTDFSDAIASDGIPVRDTLFAAYCACQRMVKDRDYKLIEYVVDETHTETQLFDLHDDPWELTNLADDPGLADTLARLRAELCRWRDDWDDPASPWGQVFWAHCQLD
jgi:arylsulfatase A-like enzyme